MLKVYRTGGVITEKVEELEKAEEKIKMQKAIKKAEETIIELKLEEKKQIDNNKEESQK